MANKYRVAILMHGTHDLFIVDCTGPFSLDVYFNSNSDANANAGNANARQSRGNKPIYEYKSL